MTSADRVGSVCRCGSIAGTCARRAGPRRFLRSFESWNTRRRGRRRSRGRRSVQYFTPPELSALHRVVDRLEAPGAVILLASVVHHVHEGCAAVVSPGLISRLARTRTFLCRMRREVQRVVRLEVFEPRHANLVDSLERHRQRRRLLPELDVGEVPSRATNGTGCDSQYLGTPCASGRDVTSRRHPPFAGSSSTTALTSLADVTPGSLTRMTYDPLRSALACLVDMASDSPHVQCGCAERRDGVVSNSLKISARSRRDDHSFGSRREAGRYGVVSAR